MEEREKSRSLMQARSQELPYPQNMVAANLESVKSSTFKTN
jgi:hypothetical protein